MSQVGIIEDNDNKEELAKLMRFWSTKKEDSAKMTVGLQAYVDGMKANQTQIFYVSGDGKAAAARSPVLEKLRALDYEVSRGILTRKRKRTMEATSTTGALPPSYPTRLLRRKGRGHRRSPGRAGAWSSPR